MIATVTHHPGGTWAVELAAERTIDLPPRSWDEPPDERHEAVTVTCYGRGRVCEDDDGPEGWGIDWSAEAVRAITTEEAPR